MQRKALNSTILCKANVDLEKLERGIAVLREGIERWHNSEVMGIWSKYELGKA